MARAKDTLDAETFISYPGLSSPIGDNHCFLNVVLQAFWNIRSFRRQFSTTLDDIHVCRWHTRGFHVGDTDKQPALVSSSVSPKVEDYCTPSKLQLAVESKDTVFSVLKNSQPPRKFLPTSESTSLSEIVGSLDPNNPNPPSLSKNSDLTTSSLPLVDLVDTNKKETSFPVADLLEAHNMCVFCMIKNLFVNFAFSGCDVLPPDSVRKALSKTYAISNRFRMGEMEDAVETLEALLDILHATHVLAHSTNIKNYDLNRFSEWRDSVCNPRCIAHDVFGVELVDIPRCLNCSSLGEPVPFMSFIYRTYVSELLDLKEMYTQLLNDASASSPASTISYESLYETSPVVGKQSGVSKLSKSLEAPYPQGLPLSVCLRYLHRAERHRGVPADTPVETAISASGGIVLDKQVAELPTKTHQFSSFLERPLHYGRAFANCEQCQSAASCVSDRYCTHYPAVFVCSFIWPADTMERSSIEEILKMVEPILFLHEIFFPSDPTFSDDPFQPVIPTNSPSATPRLKKELFSMKISSKEGASSKVPQKSYTHLEKSHVFRGMICYYQKHYIVFFYNWEEEYWVLFDDSRKTNGLRWKDVLSRCIKGNLLPCVLFYESLQFLMDDEFAISLTAFQNFVHEIQQVSEGQNRENRNAIERFYYRNCKIT